MSVTGSLNTFTCKPDMFVKHDPSEKTLAGSFGDTNSLPQQIDLTTCTPMLGFTDIQRDKP